MEIQSFIKNYGELMTIISGVILIVVTTYYAILTHKLLKVTKEQQNIHLNPVIGIDVKSIVIGNEWGPGRRSLNVNLDLTNVGNAPALEVYIESEIELRYSPIEGNYLIPARFEPEVIPFIRQNETKENVESNYGNQFILHFFDDVREAHRLNIHRLSTNSKEESYKASRLHIKVYYRNSVGQYFYSRYEVEIDIVDIVDARDEKALARDPIPASYESKQVTMLNIPRPIFMSGVTTEKEFTMQIQNNNRKRKLCGW